MDGGPPCFPPGFTCPAVLGAAGREAAGSAYGALTLCGAPSHALPLARRFVTPAWGARPPATRALNPGAAAPGRARGRVAERHGKAGRSGLEPRTRTLAERAEASLSRAGHVKPGPNLGGPPSKPEHYPATDSGRVP